MESSNPVAVSCLCPYCLLHTLHPSLLCDTAGEIKLSLPTFSICYNHLTPRFQIPCTPVTHFYPVLASSTTFSSCPTYKSVQVCPPALTCPQITPNPPLPKKVSTNPPSTPISSTNVTLLLCPPISITFFLWPAQQSYPPLRCPAHQCHFTPMPT